MPGIGRAQFNGHDSWWKDKNDDEQMTISPILIGLSKFGHGVVPDHVSFCGIFFFKFGVRRFVPETIDIVKWAAILFMLIRWSKIKTQILKSVIRIIHSLFMLRRMCALCIA